MPQIAPMPWVFTISLLILFIYMFKILIWYSLPSPLNFKAST